MPHERAMRDWRRSGMATVMPAAWASALTRFAVLIAAVMLMSAREWAEMIHQWWNIDTYSHILIIPFIIAWLVMMRREDLAKITPAAWWPGTLPFAAAIALWLLGRVTGLNLLAHAGAIGALQAGAVLVFGPRVALLLALPIGFAAFMVPFGDELIPALQIVTAKIAIALTHFSGVDGRIDGIHIFTPAGLFIVAEACSGVKFTMAMVALGTLVCFTRFDSWHRRAIFMAACIIVPIIANGVRAWGTIFVAQSQGAEFAAGVDHIVYGWIFFAIIIAIMIGGAWRYFERAPEDAGLSLATVENLSIPFAHGDRDRFGAIAIPVALAIAGAGWIAAIYLTPTIR